MTTTTQEGQKCDLEDDQNSVRSFSLECTKSFKQFAYFHFVFALIFAVEVLASLIFFNTFSKSALLATHLAILLMTSFCYFVLKIYFQTRKPEHLLNLCQKLYQDIEESAQNTVDPIEKKLSIASMLNRHAKALNELEYSIYTPFKGLQSLSFTFEKISCMLHWRDFHLVKEWLFFESVKIYIDLIKKEPSNVHYHIALANTYVLLSKIYTTSPSDESEDRFMPTAKKTKEMAQKFENCAQRAVEEFKILKDYQPNDPWIYMQLAYCYQDLNMTDKQIEALEKILELNEGPDEETLFKLGSLYFYQGENSKALRIYETLTSLGSARAENLIKHYDAQESELKLIN